MKNKKSKLKQIFASREFVTFLCIGLVNTGNGMLFPAILSSFLQANIAYVLSYIPSLGIAYLLNSKFTFRRKPNWESLFRFYLSYIPNFVIQNTVFAIVFNVCHASKFLGIVLASIIGIPVTFLLLKFYAFRDRNR